MFVTAGSRAGRHIVTRSNPWYFNPPLSSRFTLSNSGCGNLTLTDDTDVGLVCDCPPSFTSAGLNTAFALESCSTSTSWTLTSRGEGWQVNTEYIGFGLCLRESSTGKFIAFYFRRVYNASILTEGICKWNSGTSFGSDVTIHPYIGLTSWRRVVFDAVGSTYTFQISSNGKRWYTTYSESATAFMASKANQVGFMSGSNLTTTFQQFHVDNYSLV